MKTETEIKAMLSVVDKALTVDDYEELDVIRDVLEWVLGHHDDETITDYLPES